GSSRAWRNVSADDIQGRFVPGDRMGRRTGGDAAGRVSGAGDVGPDPAKDGAGRLRLWAGLFRGDRASAREVLSLADAGDAAGRGTSAGAAAGSAGSGDADTSAWRSCGRAG